MMAFIFKGNQTNATSIGVTCVTVAKIMETHQIINVSPLCVVSCIKNSCKQQIFEIEGLDSRNHCNSTVLH